MPVIINGVEIAPCICSKAKFALGINNVQPENIKMCSQNYWNRVVEYFGINNGCTHVEIEFAKTRIDLFRP